MRTNSLDPALETVLTQAVYTEQGRTLLKVGDAAVDYNPSFRLYVTTKLPNPHYLPDVCIKVGHILRGSSPRATSGGAPRARELRKQAMEASTAAVGAR